jgi:hypothetical protein
VALSNPRKPARIYEILRQKSNTLRNKVTQDDTSDNKNKVIQDDTSYNRNKVIQDDTSNNSSFVPTPVQ